MKIARLTEDMRSQWEQLVLASDDAWLFHCFDWLKIEEREGVEPLSFVVLSPEGELLGGMPLYLRKEISFLGLYPLKTLDTGHARAGPMLSPALSERRRGEVLEAMFAHLDDLSRKLKVDRLHIRLPPLAPSYLEPLRPGVNPLVFYGFQDRSGLGKVVDLAKPAAALWRDVDEPCQRAIRKAQKQGVTIWLAPDARGLEDYYAMHLETYRRTGARPRPRRYFQDLWESFAARGQAAFFFAEYQGRRVAAMIVLAFKTGATYWAGCSRAEFLAQRPNNLLMWHTINWAQEKGYLWYDLGTIYPTLPREAKLYKIGHFKDQFGGQAYYFYEGVRDYRRGKRALWELCRALGAGARHWLRRRRQDDARQ